MNKARWVSATAGAAMVAATLVLPAAGVAYASGNGNVTGNGNVSVLYPNGTGPGTTTTVTNATGPVSGSLPTTGADLLLLGVAAVGTIGVGAGAVTLARRRRNGEAA